ncbi:hypothetical protein K2173_017035 [Erythroxylum novogranatense]|uniref:HMA domain-containing protein n=1 Tax=Erythroxylum novogranatense TaxID=1862640 RepID=A0AAV8U8T3_9ROSI|nr:hypothetical protein K2173_017035 [Erythroxylum novogranatense]
MGEEAKQEATKAELEDKKEEKSTKEKPKPPAPCVLFVDLHCVGCAKKIEKSITKIRGVEGVVIDMAQNQVTIKGIIEPQAICNRIMKKTKRRAKVLSPIPEAEGDPIPQVATSQVSTGSTTVELNVNMHCEACAEQLKKKILKMRGVQTATTEFITGKVTVSGTMDASKLVDYVYRRTKKQARIIPQPEPEREVKQEEKMEEAEKQPPLPPEEEAKAAEETKKEAEGKPPEEEGKTTTTSNPENDDKAAKKPEEQEGSVSSIVDEESIKRMMNCYYQPLYVIERIPPPQIFSDENPNACSIS